jgi:hypothetical protein
MTAALEPFPWRSLIAVLRERCPALAPVRVRRVPLKDALGDCVARWDPKGEHVVRFDIRVDSRLPWDAAWQVLIHEWAHALAWKEGHEGCDDHDEAWGLAYAHCYRETE